MFRCCNAPKDKKHKRKVYPTPLDLANADELVFEKPSSPDDYLDAEGDKAIFAKIKEVQEEAARLIFDIVNYANQEPKEFLKTLYTSVKRARKAEQNQGAEEKQSNPSQVLNGPISAPQEEKSEHCLITYLKHLNDIKTKLKAKYDALIALVQEKQKTKLHAQLTKQGLLDLFKSFDQQARMINKEINKEIEKEIEKEHISNLVFVAQIKGSIQINRFPIASFEEYINKIIKAYTRNLDQADEREQKRSIFAVTGKKKTVLQEHHSTSVEFTDISTFSLPIQPK